MARARRLATFRPRAHAAFALGFTLALAAAFDAHAQVPTRLWHANGDIHCVVRDGNTIYVGGNFQQIWRDGEAPVARNRIAAIDAATGAMTDWNPNANAAVRAILLKDGLVYVGGDFAVIGGQNRWSLAALDAVTGAPTAWDPHMIGSVRAMVSAGSTLYVGGFFTKSGTTTRNRLAAFDPTGALTSWNPNADDVVHALALGDDELYVGGVFDRVGSAFRTSLGAVNLTTGAATSWNPLPAAGGHPLIQAIAVSGSTVYAGGVFQSINGVERQNLAAIDAVTALPSTSAPQTAGDVFAIAISNDAVVFTGSFIWVNDSATRNGLASFDEASGALTDWVAIGGAFHGSAVTASSGVLYVATTGTPNARLFQYEYGTAGVPAAGVAVEGALRFLPNPSHAAARIAFTLPRAGVTTLEIFDLAGRRVSTVVDGELLGAGPHVLPWRGAELANGLYIARLASGDVKLTAKVLRSR